MQTPSSEADNLEPPDSSVYICEDADDLRRIQRTCCTDDRRMKHQPSNLSRLGNRIQTGI